MENGAEITHLICEAPPRALQFESNSNAKDDDEEGDADAAVHPKVLHCGRQREGFACSFSRDSSTASVAEL